MRDALQVIEEALMCIDWENTTSRTAAAELLAALQASGMTVVPVAHLEPFAKYYRSRMAVQMRGMDDCIHRIHPGTEYEAEISVSDCGRLADALTAHTQEKDA